MPRSHVTAEDAQVLARLEAEGRRWLPRQEAYSAEERRAVLHFSEDARESHLAATEADWQQPWQATHRLSVTYIDGTAETIPVWLRRSPLHDKNPGPGSFWVAFTEAEWAARTWSWTYDSGWRLGFGRRHPVDVRCERLPPRAPSVP